MSNEKKERVIDRARQMYGQNLQNIAEAAAACLRIGAGIYPDVADSVRKEALSKLVPLLRHLSYAAAIKALLDGAAMGILQPSVFVDVDLMEQPYSEELLNEFTARMSKSVEEEGNGR